MRQRAWAKKAQADGRLGRLRGREVKQPQGLAGWCGGPCGCGGYRRLGACRWAWVAGLAPGRFLARAPL